MRKIYNNDADKTRAWRLNNPEKYRAQIKRRKAISPRTRKNVQLGIRYGISIEQYEALLAGQNGVCAACKSQPGKRALAVDHCHETGIVRGLLCGSCNVALGLLRECPNRMNALRDYINNFTWLK